MIIPLSRGWIVKPPASFLAWEATSAEALPLGHFMQLAVAVLQVYAMQPWVITSQMKSLLQAQARLVPPLDEDLGKAALPHRTQPWPEIQTDPVAHWHSYDVKEVAPVGQAEQRRMERMTLLAAASTQI